MLKGHESMMAALTNRGRQIEIIQKLWQNKDAKTGKYFFRLFFRRFFVDFSSIFPIFVNFLF